MNRKLMRQLLATGATISPAKNPTSEAATKYGSQKTVVDGVTFDSKREANRYSELRLLWKAGEVFLLQCQVPYKIIINGQLACTYRADFVYQDKNGAVVVEDVKGFRTPVYQLKRRLMRIVLGIEIVEV